MAKLIFASTSAGTYISPATLEQMKDCCQRATNAISSAQKIRENQRLFGFTDEETVQLYLLELDQKHALLELCNICLDL